MSTGSLVRIAISAASDMVGSGPPPGDRVSGSFAARLAPSKFDGLLGP
jgi:hypothetical protein